MAWAVASFFFMEMIRLIDALFFFTLLCGLTGEYCVVAFILLAERKGNILNKQRMGNVSMQNMLRGNDM